jgi:hypothetical protein
VDSGTYAYTFDAQARNEFRSTRAHNTVMVDGKEIAEFAGLWMVREDKTNPRMLEWSISEQQDVLMAEHHSYDSLASPVTHQRRFELNKEEFVFIIRDLLKGHGSHEIESLLHFAPTVVIELVGPQKAVARNQNGRYIINASVGAFTLEQTWFSRSYGVRERNQTLRLTLEAQLPTEIQLCIKRESGT